MSAATRTAAGAEALPGGDAMAFKAAMRVLAGGVVMVTTRVDGRPWGLTISSCCSLSAAPPQILVSLGSQTVTCRDVLASERFGVSLLGAHQRVLAEVGATPGAAKFVDDFCEVAGESHSPRVAGALYHLDCRVSAALRLADHTVVVGLVERAHPGDAPAQADPLLYFDRTFRRLGGSLP